MRTPKSYHLTHKDYIELITHIRKLKYKNGEEVLVNAPLINGWNISLNLWIWYEDVAVSNDYWSMMKRSYHNIIVKDYVLVDKKNTKQHCNICEKKLTKYFRRTYEH